MDQNFQDFRMTRIMTHLGYQHKAGHIEISYWQVSHAKTS